MDGIDVNETLNSHDFIIFSSMLTITTYNVIAKYKVYLTLTREGNETPTLSRRSISHTRACSIDPGLTSALYAMPAMRYYHASQPNLGLCTLAEVNFGAATASLSPPPHYAKSIGAGLP